MRAVWPGVLDARVERMLTLALVTEALSGKSFLNFSRASIFLVGDAGGFLVSLGVRRQLAG
jgi:hypothetical protein